MATHTIYPDDKFEACADKLRLFVDKAFSASESPNAVERPLGIELRSSVARDWSDRSGKLVSEYLGQVFGTQTANPNSSKAVERHAATFDINAYLIEGNPKAYSELIEQLERELQLSVEVALVGNRGSGKTGTINQWLNTRTVSFFEQKLRSNWFRIDVTKLYIIDERSSERSRIRLSMSEYFEIHSAYVFLEYSGALKNPYVPRDARAERISDLMAKQYVDIKTSRFKSEFDDALRTIETYYSLLESVGDVWIRPSEIAIEELCHDRNKIAFDAFTRVFRIYCNISAQNNQGIVAIVDGIDNVSWSLSNSLYMRMCKDASQFIEDIRLICKDLDYRILLVARPETIPELDTIDKTDGRSLVVHVSGYIVNFVYVDMVSADPIAILSKKLEAAKSGQWFSQARAQAENGLEQLDPSRSGQTQFAAMMDSYTREHTHFLDLLETELNTVLHGIDAGDSELFISRVDRSKICRELLDNNMRALLNMYRRSREGRSISERLGVKGVDNIKLTEFILLGGKLYLDSTPKKGRYTRYTEIAAGEVFPNIFWSDVASTIGARANWHGLAGLRLLQLAMACPMTGADLLHVTHEIFHYEPAVLVEHLEAYVAFGLIEIQYRGRPAIIRQCKQEGPFSGYDSVVKTTEKGRLVASLALTWVDWMYFLALDTPLHRHFLRDINSRKYVRFYRDPLNPDKRASYHYFDALIPTVATFARHINHYQRLEIEKIKPLWKATRLRDIAGNLVPNLLDTWLGIYAFPANWGASIDSQLKQKLAARRSSARADSEQRMQYEELLSDIVGWP